MQNKSINDIQKEKRGSWNAIMTEENIGDSQNLFFNTLSNLDYSKLEKGMKLEWTMISLKGSKPAIKKSIYSDLMNTIDQVVTLKEKENSKKVPYKS